MSAESKRQMKDSKGIQSDARWASMRNPGDEGATSGNPQGRELRVRRNPLASAIKNFIVQPTYMSWQLLDHVFWQTILAIIAIVAAYFVGRRQIKIQDTVELYCSYGLIVNKDDEDEKIISATPFIHVQNVGTRLIYLDKYIFNGREYITDSQILPSRYSQAENNFYRIELPTNEEKYVSLEIFYHDLDNRSWSSKILATKGGLGWDIKTLPRKSSSHVP